MAVTSAKTRPVPSVPSALTGNAIHTARSGSEFDTYNVFSSGEKAIPFGRVMSFVRSVTAPLFDNRNTPQKSSSREESSACFGKPYGGSVKYRSPFDLNTPSLGLFRRLP